eukprot:g3438.t1
MASFAERGSELFMDDDFEGAVEAFTQALEDPSAAELSKAKVAALHAKRSIAYAKLEDWPSSLEDATKATEFDPSNAKAFLRKGVAAFELEEFEVARSAFEKAKTLSKNPSSKAVKDIEAWLRKCDAELDDEESDEDGDDDDDDDDEAQNVNDEAGKPAKDDVPKVVERESAPQSKAPIFRHDWYQTGNSVVVSVFAKNQSESDVEVAITERNLAVSVNLGEGNSYELDVDLMEAVKPEESKWVVRSTKIEVTMRKAENFQWPALEAINGGANVARAASGASVVVSNTSKVARPYASHRDWDAINQQLKKDEEEEKLEGDEALNKLFRDIYSKANEDTRRAMNKSFQTSGGTVLSTNWGEVSEKDYEKERTAPDGMEWRTWEGDSMEAGKE